MTATTIRYQAGDTLRCATCGAIQVCVGGELAVICDGGGRHRAVAMTPGENTTTSDGRDGA